LSSKIRITASGWETFTGDLGGVEFKNGVSVEGVSNNHIDRLSALVSCHLVDDEGKLLNQAGPAARLVGGAALPAEVEVGLRKATQAEIDADRRDMHQRVGVAPAPFYTQGELEAIASTQGIGGLRDIGELWRVRDRNMAKLIAQIITAQKKFKEAESNRVSGTNAARAAALDDMMAKKEAREAAVNAGARLLRDETPNTVDENGKAIYIDQDALAATRVAAALDAKLKAEAGSKPSALPKV
jgi:hypothetical protein